LIEISENMICGGNSRFFREVGIPVNEAISSLAKKYPVSDDQIIEVYSRPQAHLSELVGIIGICSFVGSWMATKVLDEVYSHKISPLIRDALRGYIKEDSSKKYAITISCLNREQNLNLLIACVGSTTVEIEAAEKFIGKAFHLVRISEIKYSDGEILLVVIEGSKIDLDIQRYPDYTTAIDALKSMYPAKIPSFLNQKR
jgi:hypothetical protein